MVDNATMGRILERFAQGVAAHDRENPDHNSWGIGMAHFDIERLGLEEGEQILPGIVLQVDGGVSGNFRVLCDGEHDTEEEQEEAEMVDAVASEEFAEPIYTDGTGADSPPALVVLDERPGQTTGGVDPARSATRSRQPAYGRRTHVPARGGPQHGSGDRIQLRLAPGGDVALHRGAELRVS